MLSGWANKRGDRLHVLFGRLLTLLSEESTDQGGHHPSLPHDREKAQSPLGAPSNPGGEVLHGSSRKTHVKS